MLTSWSSPLFLNDFIREFSLDIGMVSEEEARTTNATSTNGG